MRKKTKPANTNHHSKWLLIWWIVFGCSVIILALGAFWPGAIVDRDMNYGLWLHAFDGVIRAGDLMPSWIKSLNFEYGLPLFVFYPPLFYYLAEIPRLLGLTITSSLAVAMTVSVAISFISMYWLGRDWWGKWGGLIAAALYATVPYHFVLIYYRGGLAENLAYALYPLAVLMLWRVFARRNWWDGIGLGIAFAVIFVSDVPAALLISCLALVSAVIWAIIYRRLPILHLLTAVGVGLLVSSFYWLPVVLNLSLVNVSYYVKDQLGSDMLIDVAHNFAQFRGLAPWVITTVSGTSIANFNIGTIQWVAIVGAVIFFLVSRKSRLWQSDRPIVLTLFGLFIIALVMVLPISHLLWEKLIFVKYIQYPLRWMGVMALATAGLGGYVIARYRPQSLIIFAVCIAIVAPAVVVYIDLSKHIEIRTDAAYSTYGFLKASTNWSTDLPGTITYPPIVSEPGYLPRTANQKAVLMDYADNIMPIIKKLPDTGAANYTVPPECRIITTGRVEQAKETATYLTFRHIASQPTEVIYRQLAFPGWQITIDEIKTQWTTDPETGWIKFSIPAGNHQINIAYTAPPGAVPGKWVSLVSAIGICLAACWIRYKKHLSQKVARA